MVRTTCDPCSRLPVKLGFILDMFESIQYLGGATLAVFLNPRQWMGESILAGLCQCGLPIVVVVVVAVVLVVNVAVLVMVVVVLYHCFGIYAGILWFAELFVSCNRTQTLNSRLFGKMNFEPYMPIGWLRSGFRVWGSGA